MKILRYHLHIYFLEHQEERARALHEIVRKKLLSHTVRVGKFMPGLRGPHLHSQFEIESPESEVDALIAWFRRHRDGFSVLIHPELADELRAHAQDCIWLGMPLSLDLSRLDYTVKQSEFVPFGERPELEQLA